MTRLLLGGRLLGWWPIARWLVGWRTGWRTGWRGSRDTPPNRCVDEADPALLPSATGHERQRQAPARWPATLCSRWGAPGDDRAVRHKADGKRGSVVPAGPWYWEPPMTRPLTS